MADFDPLAALELLHRFSVRFILIGGLAANLLGATGVTDDLDICYARDEPNLKRLAEALRTMHARLRGVDEDVPFLLDHKTLAAGDTFTFSTDFGKLDCLGTPAGTRGYEDLKADSLEVGLGEFSIKVVSVQGLIRMKESAGRPRDREQLPLLAALEEELEDRDSEADPGDGSRRDRPIPPG